MAGLRDWHASEFVCPIDKGALDIDGDSLVSEKGRRYPIIDGMPVFLSDDIEGTIGVAKASLERALGRPGSIDQRAPDYYLESVSISDEEKTDAVRSINDRSARIDPVALQLLGATSGLQYKHLIGSRKLTEYPIPEIGLPPVRGERLIDIGCSWGRWCIAASRKGYHAVGVDPSLGAVMAARRIAKDVGASARFVVADGRYLPFPDNSFDRAHSFSVLQHLSKPNAKKAFAEVGRVLRQGGQAKIQMPNAHSIRGLQNRLKQGVSEGSGFDVRFWTVPELRAAFGQHIGPTAISTHCFFGLGWLWSDFRHLKPQHKPILAVSEGLSRVSRVVPALGNLADSVYCVATKDVARKPS